MQYETATTNQCILPVEFSYSRILPFTTLNFRGECPRASVIRMEYPTKFQYFSYTWGRLELLNKTKNKECAISVIPAPRKYNTVATTTSSQRNNRSVTSICRPEWVSKKVDTEQYE